MKKILLCCLALWAGSVVSAQGQADMQNLQKLTQFYRYLTGAYVEPINSTTLVEDAIEEMLSTLDPHSAYVSAEDMKGVTESFEGSFEGIGIEFNILRDTLMVVNPISGGPSEKVGLLPNDRIVSVDGEPVIGIKQTDVPKYLRGPKGTRVQLGVVRRSVPEELSFVIVRDKIPIYTVDAAYQINPSAYYIKINRFASTTDSEFRQALAKMLPGSSLILDLRGNGGGLLDQAAAISNAFLKRGSLIVSTEGRVVSPERFTARNAPIYEKGRLIVLVDEYSASASEIVAGAVQDWDRGLIVGRRTFGKGLVQRQLPLIDGSAVRITVARYHTPTGRVIQRPYEKGKSDEYYAEFNSRFTADSVAALPDSLKYSTLHSHRTVYGGGGITPDVIVARDTSGYSDYWANLVHRGVINEFAINYIDRHRAEFEALYPDFASFDSGFSVTPAILSEIEALGKERGVTPDPEQFARSSREIGVQIKALLAQKMWTMNEYYQVVNGEVDEVFSEALRILSDWGTYSNGLLY
ncbi:MAG: S41 family peptidase [Rikenellaceae bacterium]|nr:S41 family peptidase [Rikenellaceae bacterium]